MNRFWIAPLIAAVCLAAAPVAAMAAGIAVVLREAPVAVSEPTVTLGDVAEIHTESTQVKRQIAALDLESLSDQTRCRVTRKQVVMRLLLAGYRREQVRVSGADEIQVERTSPLQRKNKLESLLRTQLARQFGVAADRVTVRLHSLSQLRTIPEPWWSAGATLEVLPGNEFPLGRTRLNVNLLDRRGQRRPLALDVHVSLAMQVAIAAGPIARGTMIERDAVRVVERSIASRTEVANPEELIGRSARRYIPGNAIILAQHLATPRVTTTDTVKRNDLIDVVIRIGRGEIRLKNARAMESGKVGDTIEVLNPQSGRRINASVLGPNLATLSRPTRR